MVNGEGRNPGKKQLLDLADRFSVKNAAQIIEEVREAVSRWSEIAKDTGVTKISSQDIQKKLDSIRGN